MQLQHLAGEAYGRRFAVDGPGDVMDALRAALPFRWHDTTSNDIHRHWRVVPGDNGVVQAFSGDVAATSPGPVATVVHLLAQDIELWVAETAEGLIFVHAGVVAVDGRAIVIPGPSRAGKSTLVAALVRAGAEYLSDEFAPIDRHGYVHGDRRTPTQRPDSPAAAWTMPHLPSGPASPAPIALIADVRWQAEAEAAISTVSQAAAIMPLLGNTVCALSRSEEALDVLTTATRGALRVQGVRGDASAMAEKLLELLGRRAASA